MADAASPPPETLEQMQARHRKEARDLQGRITSKKKNATKKTRKGVNDECAEMERQMRGRQAEEARALEGEGEEEETRPDDEAAEEAGDLAAKVPQQPAPAPAQQNQEEEKAGGGAGGKKRNRQKERLARRAAEHEAALAAAEEEAAGMTDRRGAERTAMQAEFERRGLEEREVRPDGHCLFSAVADQLGHQLGVALEEPGFRTVRRAAAGYIEAHGDEYAGFLEEDVVGYAARMRDTAEWGGQLELLALASVYGVEIHVVQDRGIEVVRPSAGAPEGERKSIWLAYYRHGFGLGEHYNSLRKKA